MYDWVNFFQFFSLFEYCGRKSAIQYVDANLGMSTFAGIFKQSMGARNRVGIGLSYRLARLHRLVVLIPWNRFLGSLKFKNTGSVVYNAVDMKTVPRRKIRLIESNKKCLYLKKLTCKRTLRKVFICLKPPSLLGVFLGWF